MPRSFGVMSCSLPFPHRGYPQHGSRQVCIPGSAVRPVRPPRLPEDLRSSSLAVPGPGASPTVVCCLINLQTRCRAPLFLHLPSRASSAGLRKFLSLAFANDRPLACAFGILQPLGRRVSACSSRYKLLNGLSCPPGSPGLATKPPAGLSPIVPVALATECYKLPCITFNVRSVFAPWPVFSDRSDYCSTRVLAACCGFEPSDPPHLAAYDHPAVCALWNKALPQPLHLLTSPTGLLRQTTFSKRPLNRLWVTPYSCLRTFERTSSSSLSSAIADA